MVFRLLASSEHRLLISCIIHIKHCSVQPWSRAWCIGNHQDVFID